MTRFAMIPIEVLASEKLTNRQKVTYSSLALFADQNGVCWPSLSTVARATNAEKAAISKDIKALIEAGFVSRDGRKLLLLRQQTLSLRQRNDDLGVVATTPNVVATTTRSEHTNNIPITNQVEEGATFSDDEGDKLTQSEVALQAIGKIPQVARHMGSYPSFLISHQSIGTVHAWLKIYDLGADILPALKAKMSEQKDCKNLSYYSGVIADFVKSKNQELPHGQSSASNPRPQDGAYFESQYRKGVEAAVARDRVRLGGEEPAGDQERDLIEQLESLSANVGNVTAH